MLLSPKKRAYLEDKHWSVESCWIRGAFRRTALPVLLRNEPVFAPMFCADNGRPNKPEALLADTNYGRGQNIVDAAERGVELVSPACGSAPQPAEGEVTRDDFRFSADGQRLEQCPQGHAPIEQGPSGSNDSRRTARMEIARSLSE